MCRHCATHAHESLEGHLKLMLGKLVHAQISTHSNECRMDAALWEGMPEDIRERVMMRLPAPAQFRFRTVCKAWRAVLSAPQFLSRQMANFPRDSAALTPAICAFTILDCRGMQGKVRCSVGWSSLVSSLFFKLDLGVLPAKFHRLYVPHWCSDCDKIVSNHGLLCFCLGGRSRFELCVLNPMTGRWKELPGLSVPQQSFWKMQVEVLDNAGFHVVVILCSQCRSLWTVCVFSSHTGLWRITRGQNAPGVLFSKWTNSALVLADGRLYGWDSSGLHMTIHSVASAALLVHCNRSLPVAGERNGCCDHHVVQHRGLVYFVTSGDNFCYRIFKLDERGWMWKPIAELPDKMHRRMLRDFCVSLLKPRHCTVVGDFLCVVMGVKEGIGDPPRSRSRMLTYHIVDQSWQLFLNDQLQDEHPLHNFITLRFFKPRFDLLP